MEQSNTRIPLIPSSRQVSDNYVEKGGHQIITINQWVRERKWAIMLIALVFVTVVGISVGVPLGLRNHGDQAESTDMYHTWGADPSGPSGSSTSQSADPTTVQSVTQAAIPSPTTAPASTSPAVTSSPTPIRPTLAYSPTPTPPTLTSSTLARSNPPSSSVVSIAAPTPSADMVYLCNYKSPSNASDRGSIFAYYKDGDLQGNRGQQPDDVAFATIGEYALWEETIRTGLFTDTQTNFTDYVNISTATTATLDPNSVAGSAENAGFNGVHYRDFTVYKGDGSLLYTDSHQTQFQIIYYAI